MAGSTNFLQWNPGQANQETDAQYSTDAQRTGGATMSSIFSSITANKLFYQLSTMVSALAQMLANKGYTVSDNNYANLINVLANLITQVELITSVTSIMRRVVAVPWSATPTFDASLGDIFDFSMQADVTSSTLTNVADGQILTFLLRQNATGGHAFAYPSQIASASAPDGGSNAVSIQRFVYRSSDGKARPISPMVVS